MSSSECPVREKEPTYRKDEEVEVFYRFSRDDEGYFPVHNHAAMCLKPRFGQTDGWVRATLCEDWPAPDDGSESALKLSRANTVRVRHSHTLWSDRHGHTLNPQRDRDMEVSSARHLRRQGSA